VIGGRRAGLAEEDTAESAGAFMKSELG
jgi:hypothetical protein